MEKELEAPSYGNCPNCWSKKFCLNTQTCPDCWYCIEPDFPYPYKLIENFESIKNEPKEIKKKIKINYWEYKTYEITLNPHNQKITEIKYYFKNKKYLVSIENYNIDKKNIKEKIFYEPKTSEEHIQDHTIIEIKDLKINWIRPKVKVWYWERIYLKKENFYNLKSFVLQIISLYHLKYISK